MPMELAVQTPLEKQVAPVVQAQREVEVQLRGQVRARVAAAG
jgi:hypothetical protein